MQKQGELKNMGKSRNKLIMLSLLVFAAVLSVATLAWLTDSFFPDPEEEQLLFFVDSGNVHAVQVMLDKHPSLINLRDDADRTPLHLAARNGDLQIVQLLDERGAATNTQDVYGRTPLEDAVRFEHENVADFLRAGMAEQASGVD